MRLEQARKNLFSFILKSREVIKGFKQGSYVLNLDFIEVILATR